MSMLSDMGITVVESEEAEESTVDKETEDSAEEADEGARSLVAPSLPAPTHGARRAHRPHRRSGAHVPARHGLGGAALARGRDRHRQAHRGRPRGDDRRPVREPAHLPGHHHLARRAQQRQDSAARRHRPGGHLRGARGQDGAAPRGGTGDWGAASRRRRPPRAQPIGVGEGEPRPEGEIDDEDDFENAMSLAAMEAELKPKVLETFDNIAGAYRRLRKLQDQRVEMHVANEQINRAAAARLREAARRGHQGRQEPVAQQRAHRDAGRAALPHQPQSGAAGEPPDAAGRQLRRAAAELHRRVLRQRARPGLARPHGGLARQEPLGASSFATTASRSSRSARRSARWPRRRGSRSPSSAASSRRCRRASARRARPRRRWWRPTCASSSPSPRSTPTAACSSWT